MQKEHVSVQRCDERGNPTLNQLDLIIPIYPNPSAGNLVFPEECSIMDSLSPPTHARNELETFFSGVPTVEAL